MSYQPCSVESAIETLANGGVVVVVDSEDRENEGDFLAASELITPETIHFMISEGRGHLCQPIPSATAHRLNLTPLVEVCSAELPRFAMPVDSFECETGISPVDRALTIRSIVASSTTPADFIRPGHVFPLIADDLGLAGRRGHTEAAVDLTRCAGLAPSGVLCEICSADGRSMARVPELKALAQRARLPMITIDAVLEFTQTHADEFSVVELANQVQGEVASAMESDSRTRQKRVLVVEDDAIWIEYAKHVLKSAGFDVQVAQSGVLAETAVQSCRPDVVLMDAHLGQTNGIDLVDRLREFCDDALPVIMVTGDSSRSTVRQAFDAMIQGYIVKPYSPELLVQKVGSLLHD